MIRRPAVARGLAAAAGLLLAAALAACSSSGSPSAGATRPAGSSTSSSASSSSGSSSSAAPSSGSSSPASGGAGTAAAKRAAQRKAIPGLIAFNGTLRLTGAAEQRSPFTAFPGVTSPASSCARLAAGGTPVPSGQEPGFRIPAPAPGSPVYFIAEVSPYHGPGTYGKASILAGAGSFMVGNAAYDPLAATASTSVTFRANGSGTFTFRNALAAKPATGTVSGSVSWKCSG
ncbi:MAG: hypothetical protein ABSB01_09365 [Streptosporangiaceae bacterium]